MVAATESQTKSIPIYTIAIGSTGNTLLDYTDPYTHKKVQLLDEDGNPLKNDIDDTLLKRISELTGGATFRATEARSLYKYWDTISERIGKKEEKVTKTRFISYRPYLFIALIMLIGIERFMTRRIFYKKHGK